MAVNHISYLDPPVIGAVSTRRVKFMAREGLFKIPFLKTFIKMFSFPIKRDKPRPSAIKEAVQRLKRGELVVIFPEGSRSMNGEFLEAKRGLSVIAAISKIPIIPTFIKGTEKALPVGAKFLRPAKIIVIFGDPLVINKEETNKQFQDRINRDIIKEIKTLKNKVEAYENSHC